MNEQINVKELNAVKEEILAEPRKFDMRYFAIDRTKKDWGSSAPPCGTAACIAGWTVIRRAKKRGWLKRVFAVRDTTLARYARKMLRIKKDGDEPSVAMAAAKILGLTFRQSQLLFYTGDWPKKFSKSYESASTAAERAQIAAERIEYFIENGV